jgi:hypothetical protein
LHDGADCDEQGPGVVSEPRLYQVIRRRNLRDDQAIEITFSGPGAKRVAFTLG